MRLFVPFYIILWFFRIPAGMAQSVNFEDGFEDGNFTIGPAWSGDHTQFTVVHKMNYLLRLNGSGSGLAWLSTPSTNTEGIWEFYVEFDGFEPSGSNRAEIFLMSDIPDLEGPVNGYAVQAGESGDDVFGIVRYDSGSEVSTVLSDTTVIGGSGGGYTVRVIRDSSGLWRLEVGEGYGGRLYDSGEAVVDNTHTTSSYFGVLVNYTSSRAEKFLFDFNIDLPPFSIAKVSATADQVDVQFNRPYDQATVQISDFSVSGGSGAPSSLSFPDPEIIRLDFHNPLSSGKYTLTVHDIEDQNGEPVTPGADLLFTIFGNFSPGNVIINEFAYDPPPGAAEYVELWNVSGKYLSLKDWKLGDDTALHTITTADYALEPDQYVVISTDTTALFNLFRHRPPYIQMSSFPSLNNTGDAVRIVTAGGSVADSLTYTPDWGGNGMALERRSGSVASMFRENWGNSPHPLGGTPGLPNQVEADHMPPSLSGFEISNNKTLQLAFDERLESASASDITNYALSGSPGVHSVTLTAPDTVELILSTPLQNAVEYTLAINNIKDIFGNTATSLDTTFTYYEISPADSGDVFINEFSYNPPAGDPEYVELYNASEKSLDLKNWTISDNTGNRRVVTAGQIIVPPHSYVVIAPDNTLLAGNPGIPLITMGSYFPALNNSGDDIVLKNGNGLLLDSLRYTSAWGGNETALERRTVSVAGTFRENWGNTRNGTGTPGRANSIPTDQTAPEFVQLIIPDETSLQLIFSEPVPAGSAADPLNYSISPGTDIRSVVVRTDTVTLVLSRELRSGQSYRVTVKNLADIFGNVIVQAAREETFVKFSLAQKGDIVINEILYTRLNGSSPEFIELYNATGKNFDLSGWILGDAAGGTALTPGTLLKAGNYLVLTDHAAFADSLTNGQYTPDFPSLNDSGDAVYLRTEAGKTIDSLFYRSRWGGSEEGRSLERKDPLAASGDPSNWQTHSTSRRYSPGMINGSYRPDETPPAVVFSSQLTGGDIEVRFSEFIRLTPDLAFHRNGRLLSVELFDPARANRVVLRPAAAKSKATVPAPPLTVQNLTDLKGNFTPSANIPVAQKIEPGTVVINEIMYNPIDDPDDNRPDQSEYIELRNTKDYAVSLEGLFLHDAPDEDGEVRSLLPVTATAKWIPAQGIALIYAYEASAFEQSRLAGFFELAGHNLSSIFRIDHSTLGLASSGDAVYLADSTGATIDSVFYDKSWQNPNLIDAKGIALERINPFGAGNNRTNWSSSTHPKGGTPNSENSLYQTSENTPDAVGISFSPNPFSPDGDGYEDNLLISYRLDEAGYLLNVLIYDRYGRLVRKLANGKPAGFEGSLIWDGRKDNGARNRIGIYIIVFEAFNGTNGKKRAFKKTVVLARRLN